MAMAWRRTKKFLSQYPQLSGKPMPTYRAAFTIEDGVVTYRYTDDGKVVGDIKPDYLATLTRFMKLDQERLSKFVMTFHRYQGNAHRRVIALILLHEMRDRNPEGALKASSLFDLISADRKNLADFGLMQRVAKRLGGKKGTLNRRAAKSDRERKALEIAARMRESGTPEHDLAGKIAKVLRVDPRTARRYLYTAKQKSGQ